MPPCLLSALPRLPQRHGGRSWQPESKLSSCVPSHIQRPMQTPQHQALHEGSAWSLALLLTPRTGHQLQQPSDAWHGWCRPQAMYPGGVRLNVACSNREQNIPQHQRQVHQTAHQCNSPRRPAEVERLNPGQEDTASSGPQPGTCRELCVHSFQGSTCRTHAILAQILPGENGAGLQVHFNLSPINDPIRGGCEGDLEYYLQQGATKKPSLGAPLTPGSSVGTAGHPHQGPPSHSKTSGSQSEF